MDTVCVSDIHGYLDEFKIVLRDLSLLDGADKWIGGNTRLVVMGDLVDRGPKSIQTYLFFRSLQDQLGPEQVEILLGNHDIQYIGGPDVGMDKSVALALGKIMRADARKGLLKFATTITQGDEEWLCVHGGLHPKLKVDQTSPSIAAAEINRLGMEFVQENIQHPQIVGVGWQRFGGFSIGSMVLDMVRQADLPESKKIRLIHKNPFAILRYLEENNLVVPDTQINTQMLEWHGIFEIPGVTWCDVNNDLEGAENIMPQIVGHRQQSQGINLRCNNKVWAVNVPCGDAQALVLDGSEITPSKRWMHLQEELVVPSSSDMGGWLP